MGFVHRLCWLCDDLVRCDRILRLGKFAVLDRRRTTPESDVNISAVGSLRQLRDVAWLHRGSRQPERRILLLKRSIVCWRPVAIMDGKLSGFLSLKRRLLPRTTIAFLSADCRVHGGHHAGRSKSARSFLPAGGPTSQALASCHFLHSGRQLTRARTTVGKQDSLACATAISSDRFCRCYPSVSTVVKLLRRRLRGAAFAGIRRGRSR